MDHVAAEAGVGKMTVYRHFGSKESLFEAMLQEVCAGRFPHCALPESVPVREELTLIGRAFIDLVTAPNRMATYRLAMAEAERFPDFARLFYDGAVRVVLEHVSGRFHARAPHLPAAEAEHLAGMFLQMAQGPAMLRLMLGIDPPPAAADFEAQIAFAVDVIAPPASRRAPDGTAARPLQVGFRPYFRLSLVSVHFV